MFREITRVKKKFRILLSSKTNLGLNFTIDILSDIEQITGKAIIPIPVFERKVAKIVYQVVVKQEVKDVYYEYIPPVEILRPQTIKTIVSKKVNYP